ncbi:ankyrin [Massarina eburnea CBS 473.64]|uniref:Ankyrin n=1 Tax=Massarina eburnea CBS 473.64 TaxID=1395130 RepID=A0A6A6SDD7_9PLEO|nr:ankyrin [Massarina eburnea CBS 473.64]
MALWINAFSQRDAQTWSSPGDYQNALDKALVYAALEGDVNLSELLISKGANIEAKTHNNRSVLLSTTLIEHTAVAEMLVEAGAKISVQWEPDKWNWTPVHAAHYSDRLLRCMLDRGCDPAAVTVQGLTPLDLARAVHGANAKVVEMLLEAGADPCQTPNRSPYLRVCVQLNQFEILQNLVLYGLQIGETSSTEGQALYRCSYLTDLPIVQYLVRRGGSVNAVENNAKTPLTAALASGNTQVVEFLISKGADVKVRIGVRATPLQTTACLFSTPAIVKLLVTKSADPTVVAASKETPF